MAKFLIYSVEDDNIYRRLIRHKLSMNIDYQIEIFDTAESLLSNIYNHPDVVVLDYVLPDMGGDVVIQKIKEESPDSLIVILSSQDDVEVALETLRNGVYDYIVKNDHALDRLKISINNAVKQIEVNKELTQLRKEIKEKFNFSINIKGISNEMKNVFRLMEKTLTNSVTVNILGETGTGKELVAKAIHYNSNRKNKPFIALNVAAFPNELIEGEMFGYEKGAFTGAHISKTGKFEEANGGTLFLDEISEMDLIMQAKLLRAIQEMEVTRLGSNKLIKLNFRLVVASNKDLIKEVKAGRFREDLYYRLLGMKIEIPPLRKRGKDILILANYFIEQFSQANQMPLKKLSEEAMTFLLKYKFSGNVRELKSIIETGFIMSDSDEIQVEDFPLDSTLIMEELFKSKNTLDGYVSKIVTHYLEKNKYNVIAAAKELGVGKTTIYRMINDGKIKKNSKFN
jgi:two-component system response regulator AtoC